LVISGFRQLRWVAACIKHPTRKWASWGDQGESATLTDLLFKRQGWISFTPSLGFPTDNREHDFASC
jgi:hypothetical protein